MRRAGWVIGLLTAWLLAAAGGALAHGGGEMQIGNAPAGPYTLSAWLNPPQPQAGRVLHITVGLADPADGTPVLDAAVQVRVWPAEATGSGAPAVETAATTAASANRLLYETDLTLPQAGRYRVELLVSGPAGSGQAEFDMVVSAAGLSGWWLAGLALALLAAGGVWWRRRRRRLPAADTSRRRARYIKRS